MKFTLSWLKNPLETSASLDEIVAKLTMLGLEVEGVEDPAKKLGIFSVAKVLEAGPHPDADKLQVLKVEALVEGEVKQLQVVCGAPNARAGMTGIFAPPGATIPVNGMVLKPTKIRGVESNGMMCSERELELSDEHEGIIDLQGDFAVGTPAAEVLGRNDPVIEIAITPNRPDCLGVYGVARDLAAAGLGRLLEGDLSPVPGTFESPVGIELDFPADAANACPVFAGRLIRGVKNGPSPAWLQTYLKAVGLRPINALVDITNFISLDRARPLHVYDAATLKGNIRARLGRKGEEFLALDGKTYEMEEHYTVIADEEKVLGLGGVMGGEASGSTEETVDVFVESAYFDPYRTARTGRDTGIVSDARYRFERGVDPEFVLPGLELATKMILNLCGGEASNVIVAGEVPDAKKVIAFDPDRIEKLTGLALPKSEAVAILSALGFGVSETGAKLSVSVPSWRPDVEGEADLVEEVVRVHGLSEVKSAALPRLHAVAKPVLSPRQRRERLARRALAARGLVEAVNWSFISEAEANLFGGGNAAPGLKLANPISAEMSHMRPSLLAGLIAAAGRNMARGNADIAMFEVGQQFESDEPSGQVLAATGLRRGTARPLGAGRHWQGKAGPVETMDAKEDAVALLSALGAPVASFQIAADAPAWYHPGRSGVFRLGPKNVIGYFGELHPRVLSEMDVAGPIVAFEIFPDAIPEPKRKATRAKPPLDMSDLQPLRRDFAFVVAESVTADQAIRAARGADKKLIVDVSLFDVFEGGSLGEGQKSLAIEVTLQPVEKTLTDEEIEAVSKRIVAAVEKATGGTLRS
ncbi:phenylalanine--tRNA ligase subunit beta [Parvibaculum sp.]|uniref:phenylalanine--tRNA ligase subunit beta n=1 Tax=Parvibaculum sp. TaxID=2024848 RepID=UPI001B257B31|nr:phenylalanine--tRNA ligase subunit beta [Parvibaculum sp.]MBO6634971.1 phenylalanine--tRNA ligase subunit beta [Parvibaculum sp.]MBO6677845.1 phenylalanine--tRNA ligase subunit beta [Parvibaculum sp.]MBO6685474.1 phenylalanine--tRNA ligase subunit beta [Parvibaculum sp.]MBO6905537.1 phenylalanine--tRNA ligase subunit beta [Parvibaculum sp.]